jgi:fructan beta-fructosidase
MAQDNPLYQEPYRPQFHYSPPCGWMNDPNGLVYYQGEYHLFYQFSPLVSRGPMHWGHAVSADLVHWQTLPIALYPDDIGAIWSGSVVVDADNTSGLVPGGGLVAIYSYENQSQGIAYSADRGQTWTKYVGNPVIPSPAKDFRDPKVFWYQDHWVMVIAAGPQAQIFTSLNLLDWEYHSSFSGGHVQGVWEVPDLFPLEIDGQTKWVLLVSVSTLAPAGGGGIQYFIGDFDGQTFTNDTPLSILWLDYGPDNYAGTTWNGAPDGQRVYIGWMSSWQYAFSLPTPNWRGAATLPREFKLVQTPDGIRLTQSVPASFEQLRSLIGTWDGLTVSGDLPLDAVHGRTLEIIADLETDDASPFGIDVQRGDPGRTRIVYNPARSQLLLSRTAATDTGTIADFTLAFGAPTPLDQQHLRLHIFVDESSVEIFAQDGLVALTGQTFANPADDGVALFTDKGSIVVSHLEIYGLASIWPPVSEETVGLC